MNKDKTPRNKEQRFTCALESRSSSPRSRYERPRVSTYDAERIIQALGPAYALYGPMPGERDWSL
jgi:hypothetical protein